ncbi:MAG TPA: T9SS type A sorting domain-containing protein [Gemmatimonadaceae bacterium]|nr:T9SS type A sorting domain-containing protein [Gemmatimonadaceae bacterium]
MKHLWVALVVLALSAFMPGDLSAQGVQTQSGRARGPGLELGQNYPNPFISETRIPFTIGEGAGCTDPSRLYRVSLRVFNVLAQPVAVPVLQGGTGNVAGGEPLDGLMLTCNQYIAYWDAKDSRTQQEVASGVYLYRLEVDGKPVVKKMLVSR